MAHPQLDQLFSTLLTRAQALLQKNGEMYPIAASMSRDSDITPIAAYWGDEHPSSREVIDEFHIALSSQALSAKTAALGLAYDVRTGDKNHLMHDAIKIDLEHSDGERLSVFVPYKKRSDGPIELGDPVSESNPAHWFTNIST